MTTQILHFYVASLICFSWDKTYTMKFTQFQCTIQWAVINVYSHVTIPQSSLVPFASSSSSPASGNHLPASYHSILAFPRMLCKWNYTTYNLCLSWMQWFHVVAWVSTSLFQVAEQCAVTWACHNMVTRSPVGGHLSCLRFGAIINILFMIFFI